MVVRLVSGCVALLIAAGMWTVGSAAAEAGQPVYEKKCSKCHGVEGRGAKGPRLVPFYWRGEQALELVRQPVCDMPPMPASEVSDAEVAQIVAYLKTIK
jgi:mono/diheme cytochrome c family protein